MKHSDATGSEPLLEIGDGHAAPGDGEVDQTAIETSLRGRVQLTLRKDIKLPSTKCVKMHRNIIEGSPCSTSSAADAIGSARPGLFRDAQSVGCGRRSATAQLGFPAGNDERRICVVAGAAGQPCRGQRSG